MATMVIKKPITEALNGAITQSSMIPHNLRPSILKKKKMTPPPRPPPVLPPTKKLDVNNDIKKEKTNEKKTNQKDDYNQNDPTNSKETVLSDTVFSKKNGNVTVKENGERKQNEPTSKDEPIIENEHKNAPTIEKTQKKHKKKTTNHKNKTTTINVTKNKTNQGMTGDMADERAKPSTEDDESNSTDDDPSKTTTTQQQQQEEKKKQEKEKQKNELTKKGTTKPTIDMMLHEETLSRTSSSSKASSSKKVLQGKKKRKKKKAGQQPQKTGSQKSLKKKKSDSSLKNDKKVKPNIKITKKKHPKLKRVATLHIRSSSIGTPSNPSSPGAKSVISEGTFSHSSNCTDRSNDSVSRKKRRKAKKKKKNFTHHFQVPSMMQRKDSRINDFLNHAVEAKKREKKQKTAKRDEIAKLKTLALASLMHMGQHQKEESLTPTVKRSVTEVKAPKPKRKKIRHYSPEIVTAKRHSLKPGKIKEAPVLPSKQRVDFIKKKKQKKKQKKAADESQDENKRSSISSTEVKSSKLFLEQQMHLDFLQKKLDTKQQELDSFQMKYEKLLTEYTEVSQHYTTLQSDMEELETAYNQLVDKYNDKHNSTPVPHHRAEEITEEIFFENPDTDTDVSVGTPKNDSKKKSDSPYAGVHKRHYTLKHRSSSGKLCSTEKQTHIIKEFISTEHEYVKNLQLLTKFYIDPIYQQNFLSDDSFRIIFGEFQVIIGINEKLRLELIKIFPECFENIDGVDIISPAFDKIHSFSIKQYHSFINCMNKLSPTLRLYVGYISNYARSIHHLKAQREKMVNFDEWLAKQAESLLNNKDIRMTTIGDYLIIPVQRIPRYRMVFQDLLKRTEKTSSIYESLDELCKVIQTTANHCNERQGQIQTTLKVLEFQSMYKRANIPQNLWITPTRRFIYDDTSLLRRRRSSTRFAKGHGILFNDLFLYIQPFTSMLGVSKLKYFSVPLAEATREYDDNTVSFALPDGSRQVFKAASPVKFKKLTEHIQSLE